MGSLVTTTAGHTVVAARAASRARSGGWGGGRGVVAQTRINFDLGQSAMPTLGTAASGPIQSSVKSYIRRYAVRETSKKTQELKN